MAQKSGLSKSTIGRIWRDFGLKPHRTETFRLSTDPQLINEVIDVVKLYHNPPERAAVRCMDEKSQIRPSIAQPVLPMMPGMPERRTHEYRQQVPTRRAIERAPKRSRPPAGNAPSSSLAFFAGTGMTLGPEPPNDRTSAFQPL